jgi:hypothetical protein
MQAQSDHGHKRMSSICRIGSGSAGDCHRRFYQQIPDTEQGLTFIFLILRFSNFYLRKCFRTVVDFWNFSCVNKKNFILYIGLFLKE